MGITQDKRLLQLETPLGKDKLLIANFMMDEMICGLFTLRVEAYSEDENIKPDQLIGKKISVRVELPDGERFFHGIVRRFGRGGSVERVTRYFIEAVPWFWKLTKRTNCRIFQDMSVVDVIKKIFDENGFTDYDDKTSEDHKKHDYIVQYRESDFHFVSRLMEEEGICYFFKHEKSKHTLVFGDTPDVFQPNPGESEFRFLPDIGPESVQDGIQSWEFGQDLRAGKYTARDYHMQDPSKDFEVSVPTKVSVGDNSSLELYEYPGEYEELFNKPDQRIGDVEPEGQKLAKWRMEEEETAHKIAHGHSTCRAFAVGHRFDRLLKDGNKDSDGPFVLLTVQHTGVQSPDYFSESHVSEAYQNSFSCFPHSIKFHPPRSTPKPTIPGLQSAVVVGPSGEEIYTDKYGRIKVQFPWDREGKKDENSGCWLRVAQPWAGKKWGAFFWPRIGHEVLVAFLEGDVDKPIVVGSVYNKDNMPPYDMPDNQTRTGIKTRSTKEGSSDNFNELRFEDKKDEEEIYFHAEKDFNRVVENNDTLKVGFDKKDKGDQTIEIFNNQDVTIGDVQAEDGSQSLTVFNSQNVKIGDPAASDGSQTTKIWKDQTTTLKTGDRSVTIEMGNDSLRLQMGNRTTKLDLGKSTTEAMQSIELKVGQSSIKVDQMGVTIKGMMVKIEGTIMTDVKGTITKVEGSAMLKLGGGVVMIG